MKTLLSLLIISTAAIGYAQNEINNDRIQQQVIQTNYSNINLDNNIGNVNNGPSIQNNRSNIIGTSISRIQNFRSRGNRGISVNAYPYENQTDNIVVNNLEENPIENREQNQTNNFTPQLNINLNVRLNLLPVDLHKMKVKEEKVKEEKKALKRLEDFRITTGGNSSSGNVSHKSKDEKKSFQKKVLKPIKCWLQRTFKRNSRFHFSCECFTFQ
jgi:hypothetical protein